MDAPTLQTDFAKTNTVEPTKSICRCCLITERKMLSVISIQAYFRDLTGINVSESDGLPQWICTECWILLRKSVRFQQKVLKAHSVLYEYSARCAPFPIDAEDSELSKYASPHLQTTSTQSFDNSKSKCGYHKVLQHEKQIHSSDLDAVDLPALSEVVDKTENDDVKEETGFSDYEDNITLQEYRINNVGKISDEDLASILQDTSEVDLKTEPEVKKKKKTKKKVDKIKKKATSVQNEEDDLLNSKKSIRKLVELDPTKIIVVTLNPEEQIKQREEESKASLKYPFQCNLCFKGFNFEAKLQNHMSKHSPSRGPYECKLCHMFLPTPYSFSVHSLIHTRRFECVQCGRRMTDRASILDHYRVQHEGRFTLYTCQVCGKVSTNNKTHRGHMRNHHSGDRPKCDICGKTFINKDSLTEHQQIHQGIKNYECPECGKKFRTRTQIKHHQLKHTDVKDYYCVECDVRFKSEHNLRQHLIKSLKHKDKHTLMHKCSSCDKRFDNLATLQHHTRVQHEGVRSHRCGQCGASLATRNSLNKHIRAVHRGHKPAPTHVCHTCGKAFRGKSILTNHIRTHTGEKPYECFECGRKFSQRTAMTTHYKLVHLKLRKNAAMKPEDRLAIRGQKLDNMFVKEDPPIDFESWNNQQMPPCDVFFRVTAGP